MSRKERHNPTLVGTAMHEAGRDSDKQAGDEPGEVDLPVGRDPKPDPGPADDLAGTIPPDLRSVLSMADPAVLLLDEAGFFIFANEAANSILDYAGDEILGVHFTQVCIHELAWLEDEFRRLKNNGIWSGHVTLRGKQGRQVNVGVNAGTLARPSAPSLYLALIHPVDTPVEASSAQLENLPHGLTAVEVLTLHLLIDGFSQADIATIQGRGEPAVARTIEAILVKLQASSIVAACLVALKEHLVT